MERVCSKLKEKRSKITYYLPEFILGSAIFSILISLVVIYLVDLHNFLELRDFLFSVNPAYLFFEHRPFAFYHWYRNGGIAELLQWGALGGAAFISAFLAGKLQGKDKKAYLFWLIIGIALVFMLIEDAGDPRHTIRSYVQVVFSEAVQGTMGTITELIYFSILAMIPTYAILRYGKILLESLRSFVYILLGFISYAVATILSFLGDGIDLYHNLGAEFRHWLVSKGDDSVAQQWQAWEAEEGWNFIDYFLMDSLIEEAIELIGAAAFLAGAIAYLIFYFNSAAKDK